MRKGRLRENLDIIIVTSIISMIGSLSLGYANTILYAGNEVSYDNSVSGLNSTTVQGALDEMCTVADFSDRVSALESHFDSTSTTFIGANFIDISSPNASSGRGLRVKDDNGKSRSYFYYDPSTDTTIIDSRNSSQSSGAGALNIKGSPVKINGVEAGKKPVYIYSNPSFTSSTTYSYTGISISIPAKSFYSISVQAIYQNSKPVEVAIVRSSTSSGGGDELASALTGHHNASTSYSDYTSSALTLYVWARYSGANTNQLKIKGYYIPE